MAYPVTYSFSYSYTGFQQAQGDNSFPGTQLDIDLNGFEAAILSIETFIETAFRADGVLNLTAIPATVDLSGYVDAAAASAAAAAASVVLTAADVVSAEADRVQTALDRVATAADVIATGLLAAKLAGTSASSVAIATGSKSFTTQASKDFTVGRDVKIVSAADPTTHFMSGTVTAYDTVTGALTVDVQKAGTSATRADWAIKVSGAIGVQGEQGIQGVPGPATVADVKLRVMDTTNSDPATSGYTNGATIDGVTLATGDLVLRNAALNQARNGVWTVVAAGGAARDNDYDTYDEHPGSLVSIAEGTVGADTVWLCTSNKGGTLNTNAIVWTQHHPAATATNSGIVELATDAEAIAKADTVRAVTPANLAALDSSATFKGLVELATDAEAQTGTDTARAITPANLTAKEATAAQYQANTADRILTTDQVWSAATEVTLTDAATVAVDMNAFINAVVTLAGNRAMGNPTNEKPGQTGYIRIVQDATGTRTLSYGTDWEFAGGTAPVLSTAVNSQDMLFYTVIATNRIFATLVKAII